MLGVAIISAAPEVTGVLDGEFDIEMWADVLTEVLRPHRPAAGGACEIHDIATLRLIRDAKRGCFVNGGFRSDDPIDAT
jgi:hypothetical protein